MKYFVRTTLYRQLDSSYSQIEYELLVDTKHEAVNSFIEQLEFISQYDAVLLEDDLILCKDFKNRIEEVIAKYPNDVINFFYNQEDYFFTRKSYIYSHNQCTYYPKGIAKSIAEAMKHYTKFNYQYSKLEHLALQELKMYHIQFRPCLVQHLDNGSLIQKHKIVRPRRTIYFIDYLDELGIKYEDAYKYKDELTDLMKKKFKTYETNEVTANDMV